MGPLIQLFNALFLLQKCQYELNLHCAKLWTPIMRDTIPLLETSQFVRKGKYFSLYFQATLSLLVKNNEIINEKVDIGGDISWQKSEVAWVCSFERWLDIKFDTLDLNNILLSVYHGLTLEFRGSKGDVWLLAYTFLATPKHFSNQAPKQRGIKANNTQ